MQNLTIDSKRLWQSLMEMAKIGATKKGGVCRLALTDLDRQGRGLFTHWCEEAGLTLTVDQMGNMFARRAGTDDARPPVMTGSHLDTQPTGGKFDGVYGVLAGLEVVRTLNDAGYETKAPIELAVWTNEEGARFAPAMTGSGVFAGVFELDYGLKRQDPDGRTIGEELERIGYRGDAPVGGRPVGAYFEAHIEQGPVLEAEGKTIGVVQGVQGLRWYDVTLTGQEAHAGTTPMPKRRDALVGAAQLITAVNALAHEFAPDGVTTIGVMEASPGSRNTIPGRVFFTVDLRHPDAARLAAMDRSFRGSAADIAGKLDLEVAIEEIWNFPPTVFDEDCIAAVREAAADEGYAHRDIVSGAGHDAVYLAGVAPTAMIFVPCENGISHNEIESATPGDLAAGCNTLLRAMLTRAEAR